MKIRLMADIMMKGAPGVKFKAGSEAEVLPDIGREWIDKGYATPVVIETKEPKAETQKPTSDTAPETAVLNPPENAMKKSAVKKKVTRS